MTDVQTTPDAGTTGTDEKATATGTVTSRRVVLVGAGALGAGCLLAACGTDTTGTGSTAGANGGDFSNNPAPAGSKGAEAGGTGSDSGGDSSGGGKTLVAAADVPEGGGIIKGDYVITQPEKGTYKAFSKACTHQGCPVSKIDGDQILCTCHGSSFSITDGAPTGGPAKKALAETRVELDGDNIVAA